MNKLMRYICFGFDIDPFPRVLSGLKIGSELMRCHHSDTPIYFWSCYSSDSLILRFIMSW